MPRSKAPFADPPGAYAALAAADNDLVLAGLDLPLPADLLRFVGLLREVFAHVPVILLTEAAPEAAATIEDRCEGPTTLGGGVKSAPPSSSTTSKRAINADEPARAPAFQANHSVTSPALLFRSLLEIHGEAEVSERTLRDMCRELSNVLSGMPARRRRPVVPARGFRAGLNQPSLSRRALCGSLSSRVDIGAIS